MSRLTEHQAKVEELRLSISRTYPPEWSELREFEAAVTVVVAQQYERIISQRVQDELKRLGAKVEVEASDKAKTDLKLRVCGRLDSANEHMCSHNYGLAHDVIFEILEDLRGY